MCTAMAAPSAQAPAYERDLLQAASRGDHDAFRDLIEPHRVVLHAHCYRMLGSVHDAEDALQDALLRAWRGLSKFDGRGPLRPWLYTIATNACLDAIGRRQRRALPVEAGPATEPGGPAEDQPLAAGTWVEPYPDAQLGLEDGYASPHARYEQREAVELAFIAALQHLPSRQRAVLILRDVLGFSAKEVAKALDATTASVNSALQRARRTIDERLPVATQQATLRELGDERLTEVVRRFVDAFESGAVDEILAVLADDVTFSMPPYAGWQKGRDAVGESWLMPGGPPPRLRYVPTSANGQVALATYQYGPEANRYTPIALDVLTLRGNQIADVIAFRDVGLFPRFGLPPALHA